MGILFGGILSRVYIARGDYYEYGKEPIGIKITIRIRIGRSPVVINPFTLVLNEYAFYFKS